jgi:hypothetical protein
VEQIVADEPESITPDETPSQSFAKSAGNYNKTLSNIPTTALSMILGSPAELANFVNRAGLRFTNAITGENTQPATIPGGVQDIQNAAVKGANYVRGAIGKTPIQNSDVFGAADPSSTGQQIVSGVGTAALTGGRSGVAALAGQTAAQQLGAPEEVQMAAGLAATPLARPVDQILQPIARKTLADRTSLDRMRTAEQAGVGPGTMGQTGTGLAESMENWLSKMPGAVRTIYNASEAVYSGVRDRFNGIMDNMSQVRGSAVAGDMVAKGATVRNEQAKQLTGQLYDQAASRVEPGTEVSMKSFLAAADKATNLIPSDPKLNQDMKGSTQNWVDTKKGNIMEAAVRYGLDKHENANGPFISLPEGWPAELGITLPDGRTVLRNEVEPVIRKIQQNPVLPYATADGFHRMLGQELNDPSLLSRGIDDGIVKQVWGGSKEGVATALEGTVAGHLRGLADDFYQQKNAERALINPILMSATSGGPEAIFNAARNAATTQGSGVKFRELMANAGEEGRPVLVATLLDHMGKFSEDATTTTQAVKWSPGTFLQNYGKLNGDAKTAIASQLGPEYAQNLDYLDKWYGNVLRSKSMYGTPSQTASAGAHATVASTAALSALDFLGGLGTGSHVNMAIGGAGLAGVAATVGGAKLTAKLFTNPDFVRWVVAGTKAPPSALPGMVAQLAALGQQKQDQSLQEAAQLIAHGTQQDQAQQ